MAFHPDFEGATYYQCGGDDVLIMMKVGGCRYLDIYPNMSKNFLTTLKLIAQISWL